MVSNKSKTKRPKVESKKEEREKEEDVADGEVVEGEVFDRTRPRSSTRGGTVRLLTAALVVVAATAAEAIDFVHEGFEGSTFPPAGWAVATGGSRPGRWVRDTGGPWGAYAYGSATVYGGQFEDSWATLSTYEFDLPAQTEVYYCFFYSVNLRGTECDGRFYIVYVNPPSGYLVNYGVEGPTGWRYWSGHAFNPTAARVKGVWYVFARSRELCGISLSVDRAAVTDRDPAAVEPVSLGRVKVLFR